MCDKLRWRAVMRGLVDGVDDSSELKVAWKVPIVVTAGQQQHTELFADASGEVTLPDTLQGWLKLNGGQAGVYRYDMGLSVSFLQSTD